MDAYFSVNSADASASGLEPYDACAGLQDITSELYSILSFSEHLGLFTRVAYSRTLGDAADSPIVSVEGDADPLFLGSASSRASNGSSQRRASHSARSSAGSPALRAAAERVYRA